MKYETKRHGLQSHFAVAEHNERNHCEIFYFIRSNSPKCPTNMSILDNAVCTLVHATHHFTDILTQCNGPNGNTFVFTFTKWKKKRPSRKRLKLNVLFLFGLSFSCHDIVLTHILGGTWNLLAFLSFYSLSIFLILSLYGSVLKFGFFSLSLDFLKKKNKIDFV